MTDVIDDWTHLTPEVQAMMGVYALHWQLEQRLSETKFEGPSLGRSECQVILYLSVPRRMGELARLTLKAPSAVTAVAAALERVGLIRRGRDDHDGRAWVLELTDAGHLRRQELVARAAEVFYETSGLSRDEAKQLAGLARKIHRTAIQAGAEGPL
ncbi:MarR family winged helix-turn-helix transcriptional regulator [Phaeobacter sp. HF9A]|uniref:MarR family winged helix-turn-helix transcriptional regulator n=1 Tax=Phaeobacter sp. HF9A TaxID=2721561 RepID=UPI001432009B|nr:MarR family winged helix-turn-helix transcriptional regulator [Phaeobacter sp. HF9A]NIZ14438.1 winged helix-turn-helix transcriptional regulator [Phaeobacter sp. HF9A]